MPRRSGLISSSLKRGRPPSTLPCSPDTSVRVCTDYDAADGTCATCDQRYGAKINHRCPNCIFDVEGYIADRLLSNFEFVAFLVAHEVNPLAPNPEDERIWTDSNEEPLGQPVRGRFTFNIDDGTLILIVEDDLSVVEATARPAFGTA